MKYRKKPIVIDAIQWHGNKSDLLRFSCELGHLPMYVDFNKDLIIHTLEGDMKANVGDWIIKGVNGEFYPCKPDIFEKTYEEVIDEETWAANQRERVFSEGMD